MQQDATNFRRLNIDGRWPGFTLRGLRLTADGSVGLMPLPAYNVSGEAAPACPSPDGPAGVAMACRDLFYTVPSRHTVIRVAGCFGDRQTLGVPCLDNVGFGSPRGVAAAPDGSRLYVADEEQGRLVVVRTDTLAWTATWTGSGVLRGPTAVAVDADGFVYVVDAPTRSVQRLNPRGTVVQAFWSRVAATHVLRAPAGVAVAGGIVFVLDGMRRVVFAFRTDGTAILDDHGDPIEIGSGTLSDPLGLAASTDSLFVGDNSAERVFVFDAASGYALSGTAAGYEGPIAALGLDGCGHLLVHAGCDAPQRLDVGAAYSRRGLLVGGPFESGEPKTTWHRLRTLGDTPDGTDVQVFVYTSDDILDPPFDPGSTQPFPAPWRTAPAPVEDLFVDSQPNRYLWVGAIVSSDGVATPRLDDMRAEFNHDTLLPLLPRIYRLEAFHNDQLTRLLSLLETFFDDVDDKAIEQLTWLDPNAAPAAVLPWLASWLAVDLDGEWNDAQCRRAIAAAYRQSARVGTRAALRDALWREAGVRAVVHEPIQAGRVWVLGGCDGQDAACTPLGTATSLAMAEPDGAILGRTASLGGSHLIRGDEIGAPLFEGAAHRFTVHVTQRAFRSSRRARAERVIERDKPAHTAYALCEIAPTVIVGIQARLGVDTIVGTRPLAGRLNDGPLVLGGEPAGEVGTLAVGRSTRL
jgi:phage tail-like protein